MTAVELDEDFRKQIGKRLCGWHRPSTDATPGLNGSDIEDIIVGVTSYGIAIDETKGLPSGLSEPPEGE